MSKIYSALNIISLLPVQTAMYSIDQNGTFYLVQWWIQGVQPPPPPPPTERNSFVFAFVFAEKHPHRRLASYSQWVGAPSSPGSATVYCL